MAVFVIPEMSHQFFAGNRRCDHDHEENVSIELQHYEIAELNVTKGKVRATTGPIKVYYRANGNRYKALADLR